MPVWGFCICTSSLCCSRCSLRVVVGPGQRLPLEWGPLPVHLVVCLDAAGAVMAGMWSRRESGQLQVLRAAAGVSA